MTCNERKKRLFGESWSHSIRTQYIGELCNKWQPAEGSKAYWSAMGDFGHRKNKYFTRSNSRVLTIRIISFLIKYLHLSKLKNFVHGMFNGPPEESQKFCVKRKQNESKSIVLFYTFSPVYRQKIFITTYSRYWWSLNFKPAHFTSFLYTL